MTQGDAPTPPSKGIIAMPSHRLQRALGACLLASQLAAGSSAASAGGAAPTAPAAAPAAARPSAAAHAAASLAPRGDAAGFLYGRLTTRDGRAYQGRLRWAEEEAFWGDFFNSGKEENPWLEHAPRRDRERGKRRIEVFGIPIATIDEDGWHSVSRQFVARFGDLARIEPQGGDKVRVTLKNRSVFELEGGSNDVEAEVAVWDDSLGQIEVPWSRIRAVELMPAPAGLRVGEQRLHGTVRTRAGNFRGFVQWDQDECLGSDVIDGETEDGEVKVRFDRLRAIERRSSRSATLLLRDGRELAVSGTNDVDASNRGIYVDDPRYGRVLVGWSAFERFDVEPAGSGPAYGAFPPAQHLQGTVTTRDGRKLAGRVIYDLDESLTSETLDGHADDLEYNIPFSLVAAVERRPNAARVTLRTGATLTLEDSADVGGDNAGVLVFVQGRPHPTYLAWEDVARVDFAAPAASWPPIGKVKAEADEG